MRDELVWKMAKAAHDAHYCPHMGKHEECDGCRESGSCFELSGGFKPDDNWEWWASANAALATLEDEMGIAVK